MKRVVQKQVEALWKADKAVRRKKYWNAYRMSCEVLNAYNRWYPVGSGIPLNNGASYPVVNGYIMVNGNCRYQITPLVKSLLIDVAVKEDLPVW